MTEEQQETLKEKVEEIAEAKQNVEEPVKADDTLSKVQGDLLKLKEANDEVAVKVPPIEFSSDFMKKIKADTAWIEEKGEEILGAFILPPLQVFAAAINFFTLLISNSHLFELPFKNLSAIMDSKVLLKASPAKPKPKKVEIA